MIAFVPLFFPRLPFLAMATMMLGVLEGVMHIARIKMFRLPRFYSLGLATAIVLLLPISIHAFTAQDSLRLYQGEAQNIASAPPQGIRGTARIGSQDLAQKPPRPLVLAIGEELRRRPMLDHNAAVSEIDLVGDLAGKAHFVGDDDAGHAFLSEFPDGN